VCIGKNIKIVICVSIKSKSFASFVAYFVHVRPSLVSSSRAPVSP
jgi:amino acid permease